MKELRILVVEDDPMTALANKRYLEKYGSVEIARNVDEAHRKLKNKKHDIAFFDLNLYGELDGLKLLKLAKILNIYSIVVSGETGQEILEESFRNGAKDYLAKPFNDEKLNSVINRYFNFLKDTEYENLINKEYITKSAKLTQELYKMKNLSFSNKPIFISGETGTGKRVVAHLIREILGESNFVELNCSQYNDELFSSELFGHVKGSFTGANSDKKGLLELANNGLIFLDEIHSLSIKSQKTLLKAIEEKEFYPVGSDKKIKSNFRVISATCENIHSLITQGQFRQDLYARISTFDITLTPLRERQEDILLLFEHYISQKPFRIVINSKAAELLKEYSWPQNTREIQDLVENWVVHGHRLITPEVLPSQIRYNVTPESPVINDYYLDLIEEIGLKEFLARLKKEIIIEMTKRHSGVMKSASNAMGTSYTTLLDFMKKNGHKSLNSRSIQ